MTSLDPQKYLEYLDKEMTIVGILSTFCVAAASLVIDRVFGATSGTLFYDLAHQHPVPIVLGSVCLIVAGLSFYLQRSTLASFYSGISMSITDPGQHEWDTKTWLKEAYSWHTWFRYKNGFLFLELTAVCFGYAVCRLISPLSIPVWFWWTLPIAIVLENVRRDLILNVYRYESKPYEGFKVRTFPDDWRKRGTP